MRALVQGLARREFENKDKGFVSWVSLKKRGRELFWFCLPRVGKKSTLALVSLEQEGNSEGKEREGPKGSQREKEEGFGFVQPIIPLVSG